MRLSMALMCTASALFGAACASEQPQSASAPATTVTVRTASAALKLATSRTTSVVTNKDGSRTAVLGDEHMGNLVVVKRPDGSLKVQCGKGASPATAAAAAQAEEM